MVGQLFIAALDCSFVVCVVSLPPPDFTRAQMLCFDHCLINCPSPQLFARINHKVATDLETHSLLLLIYIHAPIVSVSQDDQVFCTYVEVVTLDPCRSFELFVHWHMI